MRVRGVVTGRGPTRKGDEGLLEWDSKESDGRKIREESGVNLFVSICFTLMCFGYGY